MSTNVDEMLSKCKINMMTRKDSMFITTVLFSLKQSWTKKIPTAATNGINLLINPDFFMSLDFEERVFLLAHETWHVCFQHMTRRNNREPRRWNFAGDYVINLMLQQSGFKVIKGALLDSQYAGLTTEEVYEKLPDEPEDPEKDKWLDVQEGDPDDPNQTPEQVQQEIDSILARAAITTEAAAGTVPGDVERYLDELRKPKIDWRKVLRNQMTSIAAEDYSMAKPNRRWLSHGLYMPSLYSEGMGEIAVAIDTSGSVSQEQFTAFVSECSHIKNNHDPEKLTIIDFDTCIKKVYEFSKQEKLNGVEFSGWGGTDMWPVFEFYSGKRKPKVLIVFSDMYCDMSFPEPPFPVIWVCVDRKDWKHAWGTTVHYDTREL